MTKKIIFLQGGGSEEDYQADAKLVASLTSALGPGYAIHYPPLPNDGSPDLGRREQIRHEIERAEDHIILVAHSFGASMLLACLSEMDIKKKIDGIFLLATPFWDGDEDWVDAFRLKPDFANNLDERTPLYLYHCRDDEEVPLEQFNVYKKKIPWGIFREISTGGHQFKEDLTLVATDIKSVVTHPSST